MTTLTAQAQLDTTHTTLDNRGCWKPAPRPAYALVTIRSPLYGYGEEHDRVVGFEITGPAAVRVPSGRTLVDAVGISSASGDEIVGATAISRVEFLEFLCKEREVADVAEADCTEF